jgi:hypothetical protein
MGLSKYATINQTPAVNKEKIKVQETNAKRSGDLVAIFQNHKLNLNHINITSQ